MAENIEMDKHVAFGLSIELDVNKNITEYNQLCFMNKIRSSLTRHKASCLKADSCHLSGPCVIDEWPNVTF